jgi:hypothetical protein
LIETLFTISISASWIASRPLLACSMATRSRPPFFFRFRYDHSSAVGDRLAQATFLITRTAGVPSPSAGRVEGYSRKLWHGSL